MGGIWIHAREALGLVLRKAPVTLLPPVFLALLLYTSIFLGQAELERSAGLGGAFVETYGPHLQENLEQVPPATHVAFLQKAVQATTPIPVASWLAGGLAVVVAGWSAFFALLVLLGDLRRGGLMTELLGTPLSGAVLALTWLKLATLGGFAAGLLFLLLAVSVGGVTCPLAALPVLLAAAATFAGLALLLKLLAPERWLAGVSLYLLPLVTLPGTLLPVAGGTNAGLVLANPLHHAARTLHLLLWQGEGPNPFLVEEMLDSTLFGIGVLAALPVGLWLVAVGLARQGVGLRTRPLTD